MSVAEIIDRPRPKLPTAPSEASLPITYTEAKAALEQCERVDECAEWADRAGALRGPAGRNWPADSSPARRTALARIRFAIASSSWSSRYPRAEGAASI